jgi:hypothetical protein
LEGAKEKKLSDVPHDVRASLEEVVEDGEASVGDKVGEAHLDGCWLRED